MRIFGGRRGSGRRPIADGSLPSGKEIARQYGRHEHWGRLVKRIGFAASSTSAMEPSRGCQSCEERSLDDLAMSASRPRTVASALNCGRYGSR